MERLPDQHELDAAREQERAAVSAARREVELAESSWYRQDLKAVLSGAVRETPPQYLPRDDRATLIYPGRAHAIVGPFESLKSWFALAACKDVLAQGHTALYVDFEDSRTGFVKRCRAIGISDADIDTRLIYVRPEEPLKLGTLSAEAFSAVLVDVEPALVVFDGVTEAFALHRWDVNKATDVAEYHDLLLRRPTKAGAATLEIDHDGKNTALGAVGSQHKVSGLDGVAYAVKKGRKGGSGQRSSVTVTVTKDRHGLVRAQLADAHTVGTLVVEPHEGVPGQVRVTIEAPSMARALAEPDHVLLQAVTSFVSANPNSSTKAVRRGVAGWGDASVSEALDHLENLGTVVRKDAPRGFTWMVGDGR